MVIQLKILQSAVCILLLVCSVYFTLDLKSEFCSLRFALTSRMSVDSWYLNLLAM